MKHSLYKYKYNILLGIFLVVGLNFGYSQDMNQKGKLSTTTTETLSYTDETGTKFPYTVTTRENRIYTATFKESAENPENFDRETAPALVSKMITVKSETNSDMNGVIILRYEKQLADTFEVKSTDKGFTVEVDGNSINYIIGEGVYFPDSADKDFFVVEEFDFPL